MDRILIRSVVISCLLLGTAAQAHAQIKTLLNPATATQLRKGELIRFYKVRPNDKIYDVPYQVLIVVTTDACIVKTIKWEHTAPLNAAQKADLNETFGYQDARDFHRPYVPPPPDEPVDPSERLDCYLAFRKKGKIITWNNVKYGRPQLPSLFDFLDVCQYLAKKEKEPEKD